MITRSVSYGELYRLLAQLHFVDVSVSVDGGPTDKVTRTS